MRFSDFFAQPVPAGILLPGYVSGNISTTYPFLIIPSPITKSSVRHPVEFLSGAVVILTIISGLFVSVCRIVPEFNLYLFAFSLLVTWSSPRCHLRSHFPVRIENHLFIVGIGQIFNKELDFFFGLIDLIVRAFIVRYQYYTINFEYKNVTQFFFVDQNETKKSSFWYKKCNAKYTVFVNRNVTKSALFLK